MLDRVLPGERGATGIGRKGEVDVVERTADRHGPNLPPGPALPPIGDLGVRQSDETVEFGVDEGELLATGWGGAYGDGFGIIGSVWVSPGIMPTICNCASGCAMVRTLSACTGPQPVASTRSVQAPAKGLPSVKRTGSNMVSLPVAWKVAPAQAPMACLIWFFAVSMIFARYSGCLMKVAKSILTAGAGVSAGTGAGVAAGAGAADGVAEEAGVWAQTGRASRLSTVRTAYMRMRSGFHRKGGQAA